MQTATSITRLFDANFREVTLPESAVFAEEIRPDSYSLRCVSEAKNGSVFAGYRSRTPRPLGGKGSETTKKIGPCMFELDEQDQWWRATLGNLCLEANATTDKEDISRLLEAIETVRAETDVFDQPYRPFFRMGCVTDAGSLFLSRHKNRIIDWPANAEGFLTALLLAKNPDSSFLEHLVYRAAAYAKEIAAKQSTDDSVDSISERLPEGSSSEPKEVIRILIVPNDS